MSVQIVLSLLVFVAVYVIIATERLPRVMASLLAQRRCC